MKYRYLIITGDFIWGKQEITKDDLARVKTRTCDVLFDTLEEKYFDAENNDWKEIKGDNDTP